MRGLLVTGLFLLSNLAWGQGQVDYRLTITDKLANQQRAEIEMQWHSDAETSKLLMPAWRPGRYEMLTLSSGVGAISAKCGQKAIPIKAFDHQTFLVSHKQCARPITVKYTLYANELNDRTRHIDDQHAYLDGSATFLRHATLHNKPHAVTFDLPKKWKIATGLQQYQGLKPKKQVNYTATNYDVLADSPFQLGRFLTKYFSVDGVPVQVALVGEHDATLNQITADLTKLMQTAKSLWGSFPFDSFLWILHAIDGGGATEHANSTVIQLARYGFQDRKQYLRFLNLASHELIHTWNVRAYRPKGITPYDYANENHSDLLWFVEGSTDYLDEILLVKSGLMEPHEYYEKLAEYSRHMRNKPGRAVMPLARASISKWANRAPHWNHNSNVSIYADGRLASWLIDRELLTRTNNQRGLFELHKLLWQRAQKSPQKVYAYDRSDLIDALNQITRADWQTILSELVDQPLLTDPLDLLNTFGLQAIRKKPTKPLKANELGMVVQKADLPKIRIVHDDSLADRAGLTAGDRLIAINAVEAKQKSLNAQLAKPGLKQHTLTILRKGRLLTKTLQLPKKREKTLKIEPLPKDKLDQVTEARLQKWLLP